MVAQYIYIALVDGYGVILLEKCGDGEFVLLQVIISELFVAMEPLQCLKRPLPTFLEMCIICQERRKDRLLNATPQGLVRIQDAAQERQRHRNSTF